jgi:biopolymer transport protein ExbD
MAKKRHRESLVPDVTPLIDVVFLLLIFFMVSTVFKSDELALLLHLPKTAKGEAAKQIKDSIKIELSTLDLAYNGKKVSFNGLDDLLSKISKKMTPIELRIDKEVKYEKVIKLIDKLKKYSLPNLALITDQ